jgi:polar amino acid transport system substrate-binding protein
VGIETEFIAVPIEQMEQTLRDGRAGALLQAPNPERLKLLDFSAPVLITGGALYVRSPSPTPENLLAMSGKVVVAPQAGPLAAVISRSAPAVKLSVTTDYEQSLARLVDGTADAAALNYHVGGTLADRFYPGQVTKPHGMFWETPLAIPC